jgi:hypothetical protein
MTSCRGREPDAPRPELPADAGLAAFSSASGPVSATTTPPRAEAPCPKLPEAAEAARKRPCARGTDCALAPTSCCAPCGEPTRCDLAAVPRDAVETFARAVCARPSACPTCAEGRPPELVPFCRAGACELVDLRADAISACERDADCAVRDWACCTACDASPVCPIALRRDALSTYEDQVCALSANCPKCKNGIQGYRARCDPATRHCVPA